MEYNKNHFSKINDKKVLRKIKKHWVTISVALLGMIGGGATVATNANASTMIKNDSQANYQLSNRSQQGSPSLQKVQNQANENQNSLVQQVNRLNVPQMVSHGLASYNATNSLNNVNQSTGKTNDNSILQTKIYLQNNEAKDSQSFTGLSNRNGKVFLTAGSWYQPKMIHVNGQTWKANNSGSIRPILMDWWPDARTQYQYLTYMKKFGYLPSNYNLNGLSGNQLLVADDQIQDNLERHIYQQGNTSDIKTLFDNFVYTMPQWNKNSEDPEDDGLQGGYLAFENNPLTPNANTPYREVGRSGNMNDRIQNNHNVMEFLLGNDIDNSNPVVQAEDLNNIYYINNVGTLHGHPDADFDGFREDATGSMDYDVTDILNQYLSDKYHMKNNDNNADAHLNILEDGSKWIQDLNSKNNHRGALTQDENSYNAIASDLIAAPGKRAGLGCLIYNDGSIGKNGKYIPITHFQRDNDYDEQSNWEPNFSRINVHDNGAFLNAVREIAEKNNPNYKQMDADDQFKALIKADAIYNQHENNTQKLDINGNQQYYNVPSAYAWLLTNKDTVPEVYYGDLFDTSKPYMSTPNVYYGAIKALLQDRKKYVSGGQQMRMYGTDGKIGSPNAWNSEGILTSVRFGKIGNQPIYGPNDWNRSSNSPTTGMAVVIGEDPHFVATHSINVYMGAAHKNQTYRPSLLSVAKGIDINDSNPALRLRTDGNGYLNIPTKYLNGVSNPQVSGSLSVWVPVGAPADQDARTLQATSTPQDGNVYHSNATLDSHVLYESFSPFMPMPSNQQQSLDYVIAHNVPNTSEKTANWLQDLGITDFRFPPHYTPVQNDNSFIDAVDQNGYAFEDRYDLGNSRATKYGNFNDLLKANEALHTASNDNNPIHTLADLVLNQIYDLPGSEPVGVDRVNTNTNGKQDPLSNVKNVLYDDKTVSSPNEMQAQYGGKYLNYLQNKYPDLFQTNEISTNSHINPDTVIKQWSAKYMNGSNIQGRGVDYILHRQMNSGNPAIDKYYTVGNNVPRVFISGQPDNLSDRISKNNSHVQIPGINQQRSEASSITAKVNYNDSSANSVAKATGQPVSAGIVSDDNNVINLANQEFVKNPSGDVEMQIEMASSAASLQSSLAGSLQNANPSLNSIEAFQEAQESLNGSQALSAVTTNYWSSKASSVTNKVNRKDSVARAENRKISAGPVEAYNNNIINSMNHDMISNPDSNVADIINHVMSNASQASSVNNRTAANYRGTADSIMNTVHAAQSKTMNVMHGASEIVSQLDKLRNKATSFNAINNDLNQDWNQANDNLQMISNDSNEISLVANAANNDDQQIDSKANEVISDDHDYNLSSASVATNSLISIVNNIESSNASVQHSLSDVVSASQNTRQMISQAQTQLNDVEEYSSASNDARQAVSAAHDTSSEATGTALAKAQATSGLSDFISLNTSISRYNNSSADVITSNYKHMANLANQGVTSDNYNVSLDNSNASQATNDANNTVNEARADLISGNLIQFDINARLAATYQNTALNNSVAASSYAQNIESDVNQITSLDNDENQLLESLNSSSGVNISNKNHYNSSSSNSNHSSSSSNSNRSNHYDLNSNSNHNTSNYPVPNNDSNGSDSNGMNHHNNISSASNNQNNPSNSSAGSSSQPANLVHKKSSSGTKSDSGLNDRSSNSTDNILPSDNRGSDMSSAAPSTNSPSRLPQAGENYHAELKQLGMIILSLSAVLMSAGIAIDRRRQN